jgi:GT2 family glycosyltransferase
MLTFELLRYLKDKVSKPDFSLSTLVDVSSHHESGNSPNSKKPKISIIVPTRDKAGLLKSCLLSVKKSTKILDVELIIVDNDSIEIESKNLFEELKSEGALILKYQGNFNYSAICNLAATHATGEYLCFLNNDTEVITPEWLTSMVEHASEPTVGLVGAVLLYPDKTLQHMGISLGMFGGIAGHPSRGKSSEECLPEHCFKVSGVTFACAVISRAKFEGLGGLDEKFPVGFNDVDISIRATSAGLDNVLCTRSILTHTESQTRPRGNSLRGISTSLREVLAFLRKHPARHSDRFFQRRVSSKKLV